MQSGRLCLRWGRCSSSISRCYRWLSIVGALLFLMTTAWLCQKSLLSRLNLAALTLSHIAYSPNQGSYTEKYSRVFTARVFYAFSKVWWHPVWSEYLTWKPIWHFFKIVRYFPLILYTSVIDFFMYDIFIILQLKYIARLSKSYNKMLALHGKRESFRRNIVCLRLYIG